MNLKCRHSVRKARTIHVQFEVEPLGQTVDLDQLLGSIEGAQLRGLGDREDLGLGIMNVGASPDGVFNFVKVNLTVVSSNRQKFGAVGKEFNGTAFVGFNVSHLMADDTVVRVAH